MSPQQWARAKALFGTLVERDPTEWPLLLSGEVDAAVAAEVQRLLAAHQTGAEFLQHSPAEAAVATDPLLDQTLGPFRIEALLGEGGGRGARMAFEADAVRMIGGVRHGLTQGGPVAIEVGNSEWPKWQTVMAADPVDAELLAAQAGNAPLTRPRPGHADLVGMQKYGFDDARPVLERASARETAARVALGAVAEAFLAHAAGIGLVSHTVAIGPVSVPQDAPWRPSGRRCPGRRPGAVLASGHQRRDGQ